MEFRIRKFSKISRHKTRLEKGKVDYSVLEPRMLLAADINPLNSVDGIWAPLTSESIAEPGDRIHVQTTEVELFDLQENELMAQLAAAPMEFTAEALSQRVVISLPTPEDTYERFEVVEAPIMAAELSARYPDIKTYRGQGIDNPSANVRLSVTPLGFHASVIAPDEGDYYIDPYFHLETEVYASYYVHDAVAQPGLEFHEHEMEELEDIEVETPAGAAPFGNQLRTYSAAIAATGEFTQFHTPGTVATVANGLAAVVTGLNRVTQIYENDLAIRMVLVANNDQLIFTNPNTDGYSNNDAVAMLSQNQTKIDSTIGSNNYDIGHVVGTGGGGVAQLEVVGKDSLKALGVSGVNFPINDPFWVDLVAHEIGHQFGGNHTFNGDSGNCAGGNRNASTAYEPGSGSTIQAYAGICGNDNLQIFSDAMFHSISIDEIRAYVSAGPGNNSATITNTGNSIPTANAGSNYVIPSGTPFELTATASDANGNGSLTYSWEQRNLGLQQDVNAGDNGSSPIFRTWDPASDPTRSFPRLSNLLNNNSVVGETLPTTNRNLNFRVVVRDNQSGSGGVRSDDMVVDVNPTGSAFQVTSQNTSTTWMEGTQQTVTWNVAGTTANGINTANVDIFLSTDGGLNFDTVLASGVSNDGSHTITVPNLPTNNARIKIKGSGNIFFDVNGANITVIEDLIVLGDANDDGVFDNIDIASFVLALTDLPAYQAIFPDVDPDVVLDMNSDGAFDNLDIAPFVAALTGGRQLGTDLGADRFDVSLKSTNLFASAEKFGTSPDFVLRQPEFAKAKVVEGTQEARPVRPATLKANSLSDVSIGDRTEAKQRDRAFANFAADKSSKSSKLNTELEFELLDLVSLDI